MNPVQQNTGSFASAATGGQNGVGPALMQLLQRSPNQGSGSPLLQSSQNPNLPSPPLDQGSPVPAGMGQQAPKQPQVAPQQAMPQGSAELQIALNALSQYAAAHGDVLKAQNGVDIHKAHAKVIAASAAQQPPQGGSQGA